jgi:hypothetical protein
VNSNWKSSEKSNGATTTTASPEEGHDCGSAPGLVLSDGGEHHEQVMTWLDLEVKKRLLHMDEKLDLLTAEVDKCSWLLQQCHMRTDSEKDASIPARSIYDRRGSTAGERKLAAEIMKQAGLQVKATNRLRKRTSSVQVRPPSQMRHSVNDPAVASMPAAVFQTGPSDTMSRLSPNTHLYGIANQSQSPKSAKKRVSIMVDTSDECAPVGEDGIGQKPRVSVAASDDSVDSSTPKGSSNADSQLPGMTHSSSHHDRSRNTFRGSLSRASSTCTSLTVVDDYETEDDHNNKYQNRGRHTMAHSRGGGRKKSSIMQKFGEMQERRDPTSELSEQIWRFLDDTESSRAARLYAEGMHLFLLIAFGLSVLESIPDLEDDSSLHLVIAILETLVDVVCIGEFALRFSVCPNKRNFALNVYTWIDGWAAIPPFFVRIAVGFTLPKEEGPARTYMICVVPILRLFKMLRHFEQFKLLLNAFELAFEAMPVLLYMLMMITLMASSGIYTSEPRDNVASLTEAIWLSVVTISTVGYGDVYPVTTGGRLCIIVLIVVSVLYMAIPLGIIGGAFTQVWQDRDRVLVMQRTRDRLTKWGYSPEDIPLLFEMADEDGTGEVDIHEFQDLIKSMKIGLSEERIAMLFNSFDEDASGLIDAREFVRGIFPQSYLSIYGADRQSTPIRQSGALIRPFPSRISYGSYVSESNGEGPRHSAVTFEPPHIRVSHADDSDTANQSEEPECLT